MEGEWRFADPAGERFPDKVPAAAMGVAGRLRLGGSSGLINVDGTDEWAFIQLIEPGDYDEWLDAKRGGAQRDPRLGPTKRDGEGVRKSFLKDVLPELKKSRDTSSIEAAFDGANAGPEFLAGVVSTGQELNTYGDFWVSRAGVPKKGGWRWSSWY